MKNVVVFGGAGFLGSALVKELSRNGVETWIIDLPEKCEVLNHMQIENVHFIPSDVREVAYWTSKLNGIIFDVCYYLIWNGLSNPLLMNYRCQLENVSTMLDCLKCMADRGCKKFIGAGSISQLETKYQDVYNWYLEKHCFYKFAQQACMQMGFELSRQIGNEFYWPIITNIFGEGEVSSRLINTLIRKLQKGEQMDLSSGEQLYDFVHIQDAAAMYYHIGVSGKENHPYVIGSGKPGKLKEYLIAVNELVNPDISLKFGTSPFKGTDMPREAFDISTFIDDTGYFPTISFEDGICRTAKWIEEQELNGKNA